MLLSQEEALARLLALAPPIRADELVPVVDACGRVLAKDVLAPMDLPPWHVSMMDGYALASAGFQAGVWPVSQRVVAGMAPNDLVAGSVARIFTGAPLPFGADCVVMQEDCRADADQVIINRVPRERENVRQRGEDCQAGALVLSAGSRLRVQDLGLLSAVGVEQVVVRKPVRVTVLSTGNELVPSGRMPGPGQIPDANKASLIGLLKALGCDVSDGGIVPDEPGAVRQALLTAAGTADLVLTSGGVSVGDEDHLRRVVDEVGRIDAWQVAIKPGKPFAFGDVSGTPFLGLPGNPVSAFVVFLLFVRPFVLRMLGVTDTEPLRMAVPAGFSRPQAGKRREWLRCQLHQMAGQTRVVPCPNQGSASLVSLSAADGLLDVPAGISVCEGDLLDFYPLTGWTA